LERVDRLPHIRRMRFFFVCTSPPLVLSCVHLQM
jgi:hypothetical protein